MNKIEKGIACALICVPMFAFSTETPEKINHIIGADPCRSRELTLAQMSDCTLRGGYSEHTTATVLRDRDMQERQRAWGNRLTENLLGSAVTFRQGNKGEVPKAMIANSNWEVPRCSITVGINGNPTGWNCALTLDLSF